MIERYFVLKSISESVLKSMEHSLDKSDKDDFKSAQPYILTSAEDKYIKELQVILTPFYELSNLLFRNKTITISLILPIVSILYNTLQEPVLFFGKLLTSNLDRYYFAQGYKRKSPSRL